MAEKAEKIKKEEVLGRLVTDVFPGVIEFGLIRVFQNVYKTGKPQHFPIKVYKDNRIKGYRENYVYKLSSGEIVAVYQDVTERKRAEQIQKILYNISNAVTETDNLRDLIRRVKKEVGKIIDTTNFYIALYDEKTDRLNIPFYHDEKDTITSAPADKTLSKMVIELNQPLLVDDTMKENLIKAGKLIILGSRSKVWLGVPLKIEGKAIGVVAVQNYRDQNAYTESDKEIFEFIADQISVSVYRKKIEEDLRNALMKAEESDRLKSAFLANMSHEIRTPMNGIMGFASLLKEPDLTGEEIRNYTDIIIKSGERMLNIINNLIDISKIEAGQISLTLSDCNINEQLNYLQMFFYPEAKKKNLNLTYTTEFTDDESAIITDSEKLYAILSNLIKNSLKFTHKGSIEFGYRKKSGFLEFYVKDTGIGIPKNRQEAIFDRFVQADIEDKEVYEGAGLGLSITKAFVELLGGEIWLESVVDQGTCFYFTIPLKKANGTSVKETKKAEKTEKESIVNKFMFGDLKVMIAEDESVSDQYLTAVISEITGNIFHARTGKEAVEIFKKNPDIDLILMDIKMPVMNGYEATKEIRKLSKEVVIIGQTAYAMFGDREKVIKAGCNEYITKPVDKEELTELINSYFNKG
jgi:signal transduction histidine kinase